MIERTRKASGGSYTAFLACPYCDESDGFDPDTPRSDFPTHWKECKFNPANAGPDIRSPAPKPPGGRV